MIQKTDIKGSLHDLSMASKLLKGNRLKNPTRRQLIVYTPPQDLTTEAMPCVLFLPGFGGGPEKWSQKDFPGYRLMDYLILKGSLPPAMLCCLDGMTRLGGSQYVNSSLNGSFADHITSEILPWLQKKFNCSAFYICGHSSGGFGALSLASQHPGLFSKVASFAGDMHFELTHKHLLADFVNRVRLKKMADNLNAVLREKQTDYVLGLTAAYSPNLRNKRWSMDLPIDLNTGEIQNEVWKKWLSFDPLEWIPGRKTKLKKLKKIYLSSGDADSFSLHLGADAFTHRCKLHGIKARHEIHRGTHSLLLSQLERGLKELLCD